MQRLALLFLVLLAGCEEKGACDTPSVNRCLDNVAKSACVLHGPNREVSRFSKEKTCKDLGYGASALQRNDALGIGVFVPPGASVVTSSDTQMMRWLVDEPPFPVLCAITVGPKESQPRSLDEAKAAFEKSGAFKAAASSEEGGAYLLDGRKIADPGIVQYAVRRAGATKAADAACTGPVAHAAELKAVIASVKVD